MKKIYSTLGPYVTSLLVLSVLESIAGLIIYYLTNQGSTCAIDPEVSEAVLSLLIQITLAASLIVSLIYFTIGIINYFKSKKHKEKHKNNNIPRKMFIRGAMSLAIVFIFYLTLFLMSNVFNITLCRSILPQF